MDKIINIDNRDFLVVKEISFNEHNYIYVIACDNTNEVALLKEKQKDGNTFIESVNDKEELNKVLNLIVN